MLRHAMVLAVFTALPLSGMQAQEHPHDGQQQNPESRQMMMGGMMGQGMMGMGMMEAGLPTPEIMLQMRDDLGLSENQVRELEAVHKEFSEVSQEHMGHMMSARTRASEILAEVSPDFDAYESTLWGMANHMMQVHLAGARAGVRAREILTPDQRSQLPHHMEEHMEMMHGMMDRGWMMSPGTGGHHHHDAGPLNPDSHHRTSSEWPL